MARFKGVMAGVKGEDSNVFVLVILLDSQGSRHRPRLGQARTPHPTRAPPTGHRPRATAGPNDAA